MESSLDRLPCVPAMMEKREALPRVILAALFFDENRPPPPVPGTRRSVVGGRSDRSRIDPFVNTGLSDRFSRGMQRERDHARHRGGVQWVPSRRRDRSFGSDRRRWFSGQPDRSLRHGGFRCGRSVRTRQMTRGRCRWTDDADSGDDDFSPRLLEHARLRCEGLGLCAASLRADVSTCRDTGRAITHRRARFPGDV